MYSGFPGGSDSKEAICNARHPGLIPGLERSPGEGNECCCSVTQSCLTHGRSLCDPMDCSTPGFPVLHYLLQFAQTHIHCVGDAIQPSHPLSPPSPPALNLSRHHSLSQGVSSLHQVVNLSISPSNAYSGLIWLPTPVFLPGESQGHRSLADYSPWGCRVRHN